MDLDRPSLPAASPPGPTPSLPAPSLPERALDLVLTAQLAVAWAGEGGESPRLGWWKTFMVDEDGGLALFEELTPSTARWAAFQGAREAARRVDAALRAREHDPDRLLTLFHLGFAVDERLEERLLDHKRSDRAPEVALPGLSAVCAARWSATRFADWVAAHGTVSVTASPAGRRLAGAPPPDVERQVRNLLAALHPVATAYPLPCYRIG